MNESSDKPTVFISYSHKDEAWKDRLRPHLAALELQDLIELWDDRMIDEGGEWHPKIRAAMERASVAVCLISADYLASRFIKDEEIPYLLKRRERDGMLLLPVLIRPCFLKPHDWLNRIQRVPRDGKSIAIDFKDSEDIPFRRVAELIYNRIEDPSFKLERTAPRWPKPPEDHVDTDRLPRTGTEIFGRAEQLTLLDEAWDSETTNIVSFVAWGGVGKSSLVNKWVEKIEEDNYRGARRVYAWSFYSQGTNERVTSADMFIDKALRWFGDAEFADTNRSGWDKGQRLAERVQKEKTLLLLDGLEPLQSGLEHDRGEVKDPALRVLIEELAKKNPGLCVITTREDLVGLEEFSDHVVQENLEQISNEAGRSLLRICGIRGTDQQLEQTTNDFGKHALAINLLAAYLNDEPGREIAHAALIPKLENLDEKERHPRRMMEAFAKKFEGQPELNVLNLLGLFDRPASASEVKWRRTMDTIPQVTDRIQWMGEEQWAQTLRNLRSARLLAPPSHHDPEGLDAHPLVREHFGQRLLRDNEESWKKGHSQLYDFLSKSAPRFPDTLEEMAPLFTAIAHGCKAGRHTEALVYVFVSRMSRGEKFCVDNLGAIGQSLAALSEFFDKRWTHVADALNREDQGFVLNATGFLLRSMPYLREAIETMKATLKLDLADDSWRSAAIQTGNLSETVLLLGDIPQALAYARQGLELADKSEVLEQRTVNRGTLADAFFQTGRLLEAQTLFGEADDLARVEHPRAASRCDFRSWQLLLDVGNYDEARKRAYETLAWAKKTKHLFYTALAHLTIGRATLMTNMREGSSGLAEAEEHLCQAVDGIRESARGEFLPNGLLARGEYYRVRGRRDGGDYFRLARRDVGEAMTIAKRGEMRLHECDCHLEYARLHLAQGEKGQASEHLKTARAMVHEMGYHRRDKDLAKIEAEL